MKKFLIVTVFVLIAGIAFGQTLKKGGILALRPYTVTLQPDVTMNQYLDFMLNEYRSEVEEAFSGSKVFFLKGDRGAHQHGLAWIWYFDSPGVRAQYWDEEGNFTQAGAAATEKLSAVMERSNRLVVATESDYTDWIILPQSTDQEMDLKKGTVIGFHHMNMNLDPDVTMNQYLDFLAEKYIPELEKIMQGWTVYIMKGDRGQQENDYAWMYWIESLEARDKYVPEESRRSEEGNKAFEKIMPFYEELQKLGTWTSEYTDWVIL